jgi:hypothetical protein
MSLSSFSALRLLFVGGMTAVLCNIPLAAQAPKRGTGPAQTTAAPNRYMATITRFHKAIGSGDVKTIIDLSYFHQTAIRRSFEGQPQAVWSQLKDGYYRSVSAQMTLQPDALASLREAAVSLDGDPTRDIRVIRQFLPPSATLKFLEQQPIDWDTPNGRFAGAYVFVGVTYSDLTASPITNINFIKYIILRFVLSRDTVPPLIQSVTTVPVSQQLFAKPYPPSTLPYVQLVFFNKYLTIYDDPNLWKSIKQEASSIGTEFAIKLYVAVAQSTPNPGPISVGWPDPRGEALYALNQLKYPGLNALLVPLIKDGDASEATRAAVYAVQPAGGNRSDEPTATLRQKLMKGLALQTVGGAQGATSALYLEALSRLDGEPWGSVQLYMPQPSGPSQKTLYFRVFKGLASDTASQYIDLSSPDTTDFAAIRGSLVKCSDPDNMYYHMSGCKAEFVLGNTSVVDNGRIQCTATIKDTSHDMLHPRKDTVLYTVELSLVPQGPFSTEWKVVSFKIINGVAPTARTITDSFGHTAREIDDAKAKGLVWVILGTKVYHKESAPLYGLSANGMFLTEVDAQRAGYIAAAGEGVSHAAPDVVRSEGAVSTAADLSHSKLPDGSVLFLAKTDKTMTIVRPEVARARWQLDNNKKQHGDKVVEVEGARANARFAQKDKTIFLVSPPLFTWLFKVYPLEVRADHRTAVLSGKAGIKCSIKAFGAGTQFTQIVPEAELSPGEYAFVRSDISVFFAGVVNVTVVPFGVDPTP